MIGAQRFTTTAIALLATIAAVTGCATDPTQGYSMASLLPEDVTTIAVPIFQNDTYNREVNFDLTDAVIKEIQSRTPYRVVPQSRAETVLLGHVRGVELDQLSKSRITGLSEEVILSVTIDFQWKDLRNDRLLVERKSFAGQGLFVPSAPSGEPIELGEFAAVQQLARDIVSEMRSSW